MTNDWVEFLLRAWVAVSVLTWAGFEVWAFFLGRPAGDKPEEN